MAEEDAQVALSEMREKLDEICQREGIPSCYAIDAFAGSDMFVTELGYMGPDPEDFDQSYWGNETILGLNDGRCITVPAFVRSERGKILAQAVCGIFPVSAERNLVAKIERYYEGGVLNRAKVARVLEESRKRCAFPCDSDDSDHDEAAVSDKDIEDHCTEIGQRVEYLKTVLDHARVQQGLRVAWEKEATLEINVARFRALVEKETLYNKIKPLYEKMKNAFDG